MIEITPEIHLDESELQYEFIGASGPGGQNVNKVATAVQLRFDAMRSPSLPAEVRARLIELAGKRLNQEGILVITARRARSQHQNRRMATDQLIELIRRATRRPRKRRPTTPGAAARRRRLDTKRRRAKAKQLRRRVRSDDQD